MQQSKFDNTLNTRNVHLNSSEIFVATSLEDRPSSTIFRSTPCSAALSDDDERQENAVHEPNRAKARAGVP
jgi:hypothetical protein